MGSTSGAFGKKVHGYIQRNDNAYRKTIINKLVAISRRSGTEDMTSSDTARILKVPAVFEDAPQIVAIVGARLPNDLPAYVRVVLCDIFGLSLHDAVSRGSFWVVTPPRQTKEL